MEKLFWFHLAAAFFLEKISVFSFMQSCVLV